MFKESTWVIDTEGDGFNPTRFHCLSAGNSDGVHSTSDYDKMRSFFEKSETLIGHNIQRADVIWIERILGVSLENKRIIDTLPLSWALFPDMDRHGLYDWGSILDIPKVEITDWVNLPVSKYIERCEQDVRINLALWDVCLSKLSKLYDNSADLDRYIDYLSFKMYSARLAEQNKWQVDLRHIHENLITLNEERDRRIDELAKTMPQVPIMGVRQSPKRMYNKSGDLTKLGESWFGQLAEAGLSTDTQEISFVKSWKAPNPGSSDQIKEWLFSLGWVPETFKETKDKDGKKKFIPQINKEKTKGGGVCDSIKKLFDRAPSLHSLDGLSILNHRIPILSSFVSNSNAGYLSARVAGITNTLRFKHAEIVNLPKVGLPFADAIRGSLVCSEDEVLIGADMSALEDKLKQHFIYPLDPEYVDTMRRDDYDAHLFFASKAGACTVEESRKYALNDKAGKLDDADKALKVIRNPYKNGNYACQYNAYPPRLAITCGISLKEAKKLFDNYWELNWSIKTVSESLFVKTIGKEKWLYNPISKFYYSLRKENDRFSTLIQGTASYVFDYWLGYTLNTMEDKSQLIGQFHDEFILRAKEKDKEEVKQIIKTAIDKLNDKLKLNIDLGVGIQIGSRYSDIH